MSRISFSLLLLSLLALASCGASHFNGSSKPQLPQHSGTVSVQQLLSELDGLATPANVDPAQFAQLKQAMRTYLTDSGAKKFAAAAPLGANNVVSDLTPDFVLDDQGNELDSVSWSYTNVGDYDQNSEVNISDLAALGANIGKTKNSPDWLTKAQYADGDHNGEVNISDITPLGSHLMAQVSSYRVETAETTDGPWTALSTVNFADSTIQPSGQRMFSLPVTAPLAAYYRVVPIDSGGTDGVPSAPSKAFVLSPLVELVGQTGGVQFVSRNGDTIVLAAPDSSPTSIAVGDIVVGTDGQGGFCKRVLTVAQDGTTITVTGTDASLTDMVLKGVLNLTSVFAPNLGTSSVKAGSKTTSDPHPLEVKCTHVDATMGGNDVTVDWLDFKFAPDLVVQMSVDGKADPDNPVRSFITKLNTDTMEYDLDATVKNVASASGSFPADPEDSTWRTSLGTWPFDFTADINGAPFEAKWNLNLYLGLAYSGNLNGTYQFNCNSTYDGGLFGGRWTPAQGWTDYNTFTPSYADPDAGTPPAIASSAGNPGEIRFYVLGQIDAKLFDNPDRVTKLSFAPTAQLALTPTNTPSDGDDYQINGWIDLGRDFELGSYGTQTLNHNTLFTGTPAQVDSGFVARSSGTDKTISGTITDGTNPLAGIVVDGSITGFPGTLWTDTTDAAGNYTLQGISSGLNVTVTPEAGPLGYVYTPDHLDYPAISSDKTGANFIGTAPVSWQHTIGFYNDNDTMYSVVVDGSGNIYAAGYNAGQAGGPAQGLLTKYNSAGILQWSREETAPFGDVMFHGVAYDAASDSIYTVGTFNNVNDFEDEIILMKWDSSGNVAWEQSWGSSAGFAQGDGVSVDPAGNIYVAGHADMPITGSDPIVLKYDTTGGLTWQRQYSASSAQEYSITGTYDVAGSAFLVGGASYVSAGGGYNASVLKVNSDGTLAFDALYDIGGQDDYVKGMVCDGSSAIYLVGETSPAGSATGFMSRLQPNGNVDFTQSWDISDPAAHYSYLTSVIYGSDNNLYAAGVAQYNSGADHATLTKWQPDVTLLSTKCWEPDESVLYALDEDTSDGKLVGGGYTLDMSGDWTGKTGRSNALFAFKTSWGGTWTTPTGLVNPPSPSVGDAIPNADFPEGAADAFTLKTPKP